MLLLFGHAFDRLICDPKVRLGRSGIEDFKRHPFFAGIDWDDVQSMEPPYLPEFTGPTDTSNFEPIEDEDSLPRHHHVSGEVEECERWDSMGGGAVKEGQCGRRRVWEEGGAVWEQESVKGGIVWEEGQCGSGIVWEEGGAVWERDSVGGGRGSVGVG